MSTVERERPTAAKTTRKYRRMTARHILRRIKLGTLFVDPIEGLVYVRRSENCEWRELTIQYTRRYERRYVRLYFRGRRCGIMLNRLVWIAVHQRAIPPRHHVHHKDRNRRNDTWTNLELLSKDAHLEEHF